MSVVENKLPIWIKKLEKLVNKTLSLDEETLHKLAKLEGKVIAFEFTNTKLIVFLSFSTAGLTMNTTYKNKADVLIKGTPINFITVLATSKQGSTNLPTDMQIRGDIVLGQKFQLIMQNIEIDLEELLAKWTGDSVAYELGRFIRGSNSVAVNAGKTLAMDISEYLRFETEMLPDELLVDDFCKEVDVLREDVDRLSQRVSQTVKKIKSKDQST